MMTYGDLHIGQAIRHDQTDTAGTIAYQDSTLVEITVPDNRELTLSPNTVCEGWSVDQSEGTADLNEFFLAALATGEASAPARQLPPADDSEMHTTVWQCDGPLWS
jgi:hypothetical protein